MTTGYFSASSYHLLHIGMGAEIQIKVGSKWLDGEIKTWTLGSHTFGLNQINIPYYVMSMLLGWTVWFRLEVNVDLLLLHNPKK